MHLTRIEELPQLWNILLGDMTLVGPRPERLESAAVLNQELPGYPKRHAVKPGLIGWAQIQSRFGIGRSAENAQIELERDLYYVKHACLGMDLQILLRATLACVRAWPRSLIRWSATTLNVNRSSTVKRFMDILMALTGMVVLLPLLALVAAFVFAMMGRPVLFTQVRPGRHGRPFRMYKFRTMRNAFDSAGRPLSDADRLTRGGRLLRQLSLDELPQLWNVIKGDLSVVGPRPQLMDYLHRYTPEQARRHDVMPGITGWAQVNGRNAISWNERFELDVWYVDHWSLWLDFKILAMTVTTVLTGRGVSAPGQATMAPFPGTLTSASGSAD
jgi:lipopolysaccharide/colanic/teichoic acid biosynthesis glycosyltransferase